MSRRTGYQPLPKEVNVRAITKRGYSDYQILRGLSYFFFIALTVTAVVLGGVALGKITDHLAVKKHADHPLVGWWSCVSKGANVYTDFFSQFPRPQLIHITVADTLSGIDIKVYSGTVDRAHEDFLTNITVYPVRVVNPKVIEIQSSYSLSRTVSGIPATLQLPTSIFFVYQTAGPLAGLAWLDASYSAQLNQLYPGDSGGFLYEKLEHDPSSTIRPRGIGDNRFTDVDSRRFMFEQLNDIIFTADYPALSGPDTTSERLMRQPERRALFTQIMETGVARASIPIFRIEKTTKNSGTTNILVKGVFPYANVASDVTLSGFISDYAILNGNTYQCVGASTTTGNNLDGQSPFYLASENIYYVIVKLNTTALPEFDGTTHISGGGAFVTPSIVGPITEDIEYRQWLDAAIYYVSRVVKQATHARIGFYAESNGPGFIDSVDSKLAKSAVSTWLDVANIFKGTNLNPILLSAKFKSVTQEPVFAPPNYLPTWTSFFVGPINQRFSELGIPGAYSGDYPEYSIGTLPAPYFNIPFENYLLPSTRRWLYWRVKPDTPVVTDTQKNVWTLAYDSSNTLVPEMKGYASVGPGGLNTGGQLGGSRLEGLVSSTPWGVSNSTLSDNFWSPYTEDAGYGYIDPTTFNAGMIDPSHVGGRKIGYLYFYYNLLHTPQYYTLPIEALADFGNPDLSTSGDPNVRARQQYDGERAIISTLMHYFVTELGVDAIIIDNRMNGGDYHSHSLVECFGDIRSGISGYGAFQKHDDHFIFSNEMDVDVYSGMSANSRTVRRLNTTTPYGTIRPDLMEIAYPGSVFKNGPVIIIDSEGAGSGGDQFPWFFVGDSGTGDIGNGVTTKIVGTIDAVFDGSNYGGTSLIRSEFGSEFGDNSPIGSSTRGESTLSNIIAGFATHTRYNQTGPLSGLVPKNSDHQGPIYMSSNGGLDIIVDGALSTNILDTVYFDFGYVGGGSSVDGTLYSAGHWDNPPHGIVQVSGFPGQPNSTDLTTLRDSWFEEAIRVTRICLGDTLIRRRSISSKSNRARTISDARLSMLNKMSDPIECKKILHAKEKVMNIREQNSNPVYHTDHMQN